LHVIEKDDQDDDDKNRSYDGFDAQSLNTDTHHTCATMTTTATGATVARDIRALHSDLDAAQDKMTELQLEFETDLHALAKSMEDAFDAPSELNSDFGSVTGMSFSTITTMGGGGGHPRMSATPNNNSSFGPNSNHHHSNHNHNNANFVEDLASILTGMTEDDDYFPIGDDDDNDELGTSLASKRSSAPPKYQLEMGAFMAEVESRMRQAQQQQQSQHQPVGYHDELLESQPNNAAETTAANKEGNHNDATTLTTQDDVYTDDGDHDHSHEHDDNSDESSFASFLPPQDHDDAPEEDGVSNWLTHAWTKFHSLMTLKQRMRHERIRRQQLKQQMLQQIKEQQAANPMDTIQEDEDDNDSSSRSHSSRGIGNMPTMQEAMTL